MMVGRSTTVMYDFFQLTLIIFAFICCLDICKSTPPHQLCKDLLPADYEIHKPSDTEGEETNVFTWVQIIDFGNINEANMDFLLHVFITNIWNDSRLIVDSYKNKKMPTILYSGCRDHIWTPDIFYETVNDAKSDQKHLPSTLLKILPDGAVYLSTKYLFRAGCQMNLQLYPFDTQECLFTIAMLSPDSVAKLYWIGETESPYREERISVQMIKNPELLLFSIKQPTPHSVIETLAEGNYTSLIINFTLVRRLMGTILNIYIPSTMIVVMSWVGFWLGVDAVPARVALCVTSLLTLCTQVHQYRVQLPPVNYLKAMDIWLFICILMVFLTLVEFAVSFNSIHTDRKDYKVKSPQRGKRSQISIASHTNSWSSNTIDGNRKLNVNSSASSSTTGKISNEGKLHAQCFNRTDRVSRYAFPLSFTLFAIVYWTYYMSKYDK